MKKASVIFPVTVLHQRTITLLALLFLFISATYAADEGYIVLHPEKSKYLHTSDHFAVRWNDADNVILTDAEIQTGLSNLEAAWTRFVDEIGFEKPYGDDPVKYKVSVNVSDQGYATGAGTGEKDPELWVHYNAFKDGGVLAHEFAHTLQFATRGFRDSKYVGWMWECHAQFMRFQMYPDNVDCAELLVNMPHIYYGSTRNRYCNWHFWEFLKDHYGYEIVNDIWAKAKKNGVSGYLNEDPFTVLARNRNWSTEELNDHFGEWAMHNVTWDYANGATFRKSFGSYADRAGGRRLRVTLLDELDHAKRRFAVPHYWAPQRWGYNLVRLFPDSKGTATTVTVTFQGVVQETPVATNFGSFANQPETVPQPASGWRWGLVAIDNTGSPRYSDLQRGASAKVPFAVLATDTALWLVVVGTPTSIHQIMWDQMYYTIYRFPWMAELEGALPEGYQPNAPMPSKTGAAHANGGGWVASGANVDATAYVGPHALVLGGTVSGNARIEDYAVVEAGKVADNARVGALTIVNGANTVINGSARVATVIGRLADNGTFFLSGTAQVLGDIELRTSLSKGAFYGIVESAMVNDAQYGANRTVPSPEVTFTGPYEWNENTEITAPSRQPLPSAIDIHAKIISPRLIKIYGNAEPVTPACLALLTLTGRVVATTMLPPRQTTWELDKKLGSGMFIIQGKSAGGNFRQLIPVW